MEIGIIVVLAVCLGFTLWQRHKAIVSLKEKQLEFQKEKDEIQNQYAVLSEEQSALQNEYDMVKASEGKYKKLALVDLLTSLPNRVALIERMDHIFLTLRQEEQVYAMYIDIDNLKDVNDSIGYTYGDELLIDVSHRLKQTLNENDFLARINGDEFVIITQNVESVDVYEEKVRKLQTVFSYPFTLARKEYFISLNIGIGKFGKDGKNSQSLLKNANVAMKEAKEMGKNHYCYYNDTIQTKLTQHIQRQSEIRTAMERNEFTLVYQPILSLKRQKVVAVEALLRWNHPKGGLKLPYEFLDALVESGLIVSLGEQMFGKACRQFVQWKKEGYQGLSLMFNLSMRQMLDDDFIEMIETVIHETGILPEEIVFDIGEEIIQKNKSMIYPRIKKLQQIGVKIALDHYGVGDCSLRMMKEIEFQYIKLDASLIEDVVNNKVEQAFLNNMVQIANGLGRIVIYEGIEEAEQLEALEHCQCDYVQGFLFSKPLEVDEVSAYLQSCMVDM